MISMQERGDLLADGRFDAAATLARLAEETADAIRSLGRRGAVVAVSGGVDSGVAAGICVRALGPEQGPPAPRLPERDVGDASSDSAGARGDSGARDSRSRSRLRSRGSGATTP